ncbi:hypothetical protein LTS17_008786 [Exophiala oligosperma]
MECLQGQSKPRSRAPKSSRKKKDPIANSQPTSTVSTGNSASQDQTARDGELPSFIKALPAHLTVEDISYLRHRGIFQIPATGCRNEILRAYFHFVHPLMPLLDVETFLGPMLAGDCSDKISLMLLYAVLCSGAAHIEIGVLQALGYETRKSARKAFFDRARLLYDFDCESDRVALVQASLLMTYWWQTGTQHKDRRFWIREGVSLALDLGLERDLETSTSMRRRRILKRLWWCCFMRDQFVALMTWTPAHLGARHRHLPMLELEDFDLEPYSALIRENFGQWPLVSHAETRSQLAGLCIEKARLCVCISRILEARYASRRQEAGNQMMTILVPKRAAASQYEVIEHDHELQGWYHNLSESKTLDIRDAIISRPKAGMDAVSVQKAHLKLLFLSATLALYRPLAVGSANMRLSASQELSSRKLRETAEEVAHIAKSIRDLELGTPLSPKGVTLFLPILLVHLQDLKPETDLLHKSRLEKYYDCMHILDSIGGAVSEDGLLTELETAFQRLNIVPAIEQSPTIPRPLSTSCWQASVGIDHSSIPQLSSLGIVTSFEMDFLRDLTGGATIMMNSSEEVPRDDRSDSAKQAGAE